MGGAFDDDVLFIGAGRDFIVNLVVAQEVMAAHAKDQDRHRDLLQMTRRRVVVGTIVDVVHRLFGADRPRAEKRAHGEHF